MADDHSSINPRQAAEQILKSVVESYHEILLGVRQRELAKAQPGPESKSEKPIKTGKVFDLVKAQVERAKTLKAEPQPNKKPTCNIRGTPSNQIKNPGPQVIAATRDLLGKEEKSETSEESVCKSEASVALVSLMKSEIFPDCQDIKVHKAPGSGGQITKGKKLGKDEFKPTNTFTNKLAAVKQANEKDKQLGKEEVPGQAPPPGGKPVKPPKTPTAAPAGIPAAPKAPGAPGMVKEEKSTEGSPEAEMAKAAMAAGAATPRQHMVSDAFRAQAAHQEAQEPQAHPKDPSAYDAEAFRPASPGAAGIQPKPTMPRPPGFKSPAMVKLAKRPILPMK